MVKKRRIEKRDVENIPYHIIISKILPFIELIITKENHTQDLCYVTITHLVSHLVFGATPKALSP